MAPRTSTTPTLFLSTPSARRATGLLTWDATIPRNFYPRPPRGGRPWWFWTKRPVSNFYPRPPRGGRLLAHEVGAGKSFISIHALREEGDNKIPISESTLMNFYPRPPRGGRPIASWMQTGCLNFYPRPPRGGRLDFLRLARVSLSISIHALREEGDLSACPRATFGVIFLSTPSARRATMRCADHALEYRISIHALREEGDLAIFGRTAFRALFLSTPSARRATVKPGFALCVQLHFYPRPPRGGRPSR